MWGLDYGRVFEDCSDEMSRFTDTLREFYRPAGVLGGEPVDRARLRAAISQLAAQLRRLYWIRVVLVAAVFLVEIGAMLMNLDKPAIVGGIAAAFGLTVAGAIRAVQTITNEMAETNLLLVLIPEMDADSLQHLVNTLSVKLHERTNQSKTT
jgi:hypothetical protein